jgi:hypothetical protein
MSLLFIKLIALNVSFNDISVNSGMELINSDKLNVQSNTTVSKDLMSAALLVIKRGLVYLKDTSMQAINRLSFSKSPITCCKQLYTLKEGRSLL